jgi:hypothetical protein
MSFNCSFGQGVNNVWLLGYSSSYGLPCGGTRIDFSSGSPDTSYEYRDMNFRDCNASIGDSLGRLLFYTNGVYIANNLGDTMSNGSGLNPSSYTTSWSPVGLRIPQGDVIIRVPGSAHLYYLFHETLEFTTTTFHTFQLLYSLVDMSLDNSNGVVIQKNIAILQDTLVTGGITACKHANGRDWWLITHQFNTSVWYTMLVTPYGIQGPYSQNIGSVMTENYLNQTSFSPDGSKFACYQAISDLDIYDFDRCSGLLSNNVHIDFTDTSSGGLAFSANSKMLYVSAEFYVYQFDLTSANVANSLDTVGILDNFSDPAPPFYTTFYLSQLAPDGKIYINTGNSTRYLHIINKPDSLGVACDLQQHSLRLPTFNGFTIPNHPNYFLGALGGTICDSLPTIVSTLQSSKDDFKLFPNPARSTEEIMLTYRTLQEPASISIFNTNGEEIIKYHLPQWSSMQRFRLPEISAGVYLARLTSKTREENLKFVVEE